jgi:hypothetical protein
MNPEAVILSFFEELEKNAGPSTVGDGYLMELPVLRE